MSKKLIISYDISCNKVRTRFHKFITKYGIRLQYSVYEIKNSERILNIIITKINHYFEKQFTQSDSVIIFNIKCEKIYRYGYAKNEEKDLLFI